METLIRRWEWQDFRAQQQYKAALGMVKPVHEPEVRRGILAEIERNKGQNLD